MAQNTLPRYVNDVDSDFAAITANATAETILTAPAGGLRLANLAFTTDDSAALGSNAANIHGPGQPRNLTLIIDAVLDNISASYYPWYLATNPMDVGHVNLYNFNCQTTPFTAAAPTPTGDFRGIIWVLEHDFVFAQTDWRGIYCNRGASK